MIKNTFKYLTVAAAAIFGFSACVEKAPEYEPADPAGTAEVFFAPTLPSSYNLKGNTGTITVNASRADASGALTVNLSSTADAAFSIPSSISFASGSNTAPIDITFDPSVLVEDKAYPFTLTITNETTPYGASEYSFTASVPSAWSRFGSGDLNEVWWGEVEPNKVIYYQDLSETLRICKIEDCFGFETIKAGDPYDVQDYIFYWNTETNQIYIPIRSMGYVPSNYGVPVYYGDESAFYNKYWGADKGAQNEEGTPEWFAFCDRFRAAYPEDYYPYYDGNGGFYLADQYIVGMPGTSDYLGRYNAGSDWDFLICNGFVRITDYNDERHFGASSALYEGTLASMMFSADGEPVEFEQSLRYDADYEFDPEEFDPAKDEIITTTYYLADYFDEGHCLAFTAPIPELLENGSEITDVDNEQDSGMQIIGHNLFVNIKKGTVTFPESEAGEDSEEDLLPIFNIVVNAYTKDAEGNVDIEFGTVEEVFTALEYGKDGYTIDDIYGGYKEDYVGTWSMFSTEDGEEYNYDVVITDEGQDEEGNEIVKIKNLSGYDGWNGLVDELYATWSNYALYVPGQTLENPLNYGGSDYTIQVYPADPDTQKYYGQSNTVLAGICNDGALAFVNRYNGVNLSGFYYLAEGLGGLTMFGNIYGFTANGESAGRVRNFYEEAKNTGISGKAATASMRIGNMRMVKKTSSVAPVRRVNINNFVKAEKNIGEIKALPTK